MCSTSLNLCHTALLSILNCAVYLCGMTCYSSYYSDVHGVLCRIPPPIKYPTPYGGRLEWTMPGGNTVTAHLKDKQKVRHKKRWSQVMIGMQLYKVLMILAWWCHRWFYNFVEYTWRHLCFVA